MSRTKQQVLSLILLAVWGAEARAQGTIVWSDEFGGTELNTANWEPMIGNGCEYGVCGWGNNELQYYTNRLQNLFVAGGHLHIVARQENYAGHPYTSARIRSANRQDFLYGRMEARIKLPSTKGMWPAFWMMPTNYVYGGWAASGELDIMESGNFANTIYGTIHYGGTWPDNTASGGTFSNGMDFSQAFHVYAVEWTPDVIRWYVDGVLYTTQISETWFSANAPDNDRAPFDQLFHFLLNVAVGGDFPGPPDASSVFPQEMLVDWVRVYEPGAPAQSAFGGQPHAIPGQLEAEDFDQGGAGVAYLDCDPANQGGAYRPDEGVDIEASTEGGFNVGWICAGEWLEYTVDVAAAGGYEIQARVASQSTGGSFRLESDGINLTGDISVPSTGGWQTWATVTTIVNLGAGEQVLRFVNRSTSASYNLKTLRFTNLSIADINRDGEVNLADYAIITECTTGPGPSSPSPGCNLGEFLGSDLDDDGDVDLVDFACFLQLY